MTPYYEHAGIQIFHGDCREVLPGVEFDFALTDPPYGVNIGSSNNPRRDGGYGGHLGKSPYLSYEDTYENFLTVVVPVLTILATGRAAIFSGPHIHEQPKPNAIGGIWSPAATGRTPWGSKNFLPILFYGVPPEPGRHRPMVIQSTERSGSNGHPCPKPLPWLRWLVLLGSQTKEVILDPFMGSGTTLVAAKLLGRSAIGIEIEERYCELAARRLEQEMLDFAEPVVVRPVAEQALLTGESAQ